jgi:hypothetical protein
MDPTDALPCVPQGHDLDRAPASERSCDYAPRCRTEWQKADARGRPKPDGGATYKIMQSVSLPESRD